MKRKYLLILIIFVLLCAIIFLGYKIYKYIDYVPRAEEVDPNIIGNEFSDAITVDNWQTINLVI